jgi:hypothetical protein
MMTRAAPTLLFSSILLWATIISVASSGDVESHFVVIDEESGLGYTVEEFLELTEDHDDWDEGGWDINSRMTRVAKELFWQINGEKPCSLDDPMLLVPALEKGVENILKHYNPRDGLVGVIAADLVHRLGGTLKGTNIYWVMGMEHPYLRELADSLIRHEESGDWRRQADGRETVPRNVAELVTLCLETTNYRREELFGVLESLCEWIYWDFGTHEYTIQYALGFIGTMLHWNNTRFGNPLWTRTRGLSYPYVLTTEAGKWPGKVQVKCVENPWFVGTEESDWFDHRQTRVRMARSEEPQAAPFWAEGPIELWVDPEDGEDVPEEMGENTYRFRDMEPWEEGECEDPGLVYYLTPVAAIGIVAVVLGHTLVTRNRQVLRPES